MSTVKSGSLTNTQTNSKSFKTYTLKSTAKLTGQMRTSTSSMLKKRKLINHRQWLKKNKDFSQASIRLLKSKLQMKNQTSQRVLVAFLALVASLRKLKLQICLKVKAVVCSASARKKSLNLLRVL